MFSSGGTPGSGVLTSQVRCRRQLRLFPSQCADSGLEAMQAAQVLPRPLRDLLINKTWVVMLVAVLRRRTIVALGHDTSSHCISLRPRTVVPCVGAEPRSVA